MTCLLLLLQRWVDSALRVLTVAGLISCLLCGCRPAVNQRKSPSMSPIAMPVAADVKFKDVTRAAGLEFRQYFGGCGQRYFIEQVASGATVIDANGDGYPDLYFPQPQPLGSCKFNNLPWHQRLYLNDGKGHFTLSTAAFRGVDTDYGLAAAVGDYDNDGRQDLFVCCYGKSRLFHNRGDGTFEDVTDKAGIKVNGFCTGAVWFDADGNGRQDLFVLRYCHWSLDKDIQCLDGDGKPDVCNPVTYTAETNLYYHNNGDGTFTERTLAAGFGNQQRRSLSAVACDFDGDGKLDLFVANDLGPNYLFHNMGHGKFEEVAMQQGVAFGASGRAQANMGTACGDYNNSGRPSVLVTTFSNEPYTLYRNDGGFFTDVSAPAGIAEPTLPNVGFGTGFFDARNNGSLDLFFANGHVSPFARTNFDKDSHYKERNQLLLNDGSGHFTEALDALPSDDVRVHRGAVFADFNGDGRIDVLTTATNDRPTLLQNTSHTGNWLILSLVDKYGCCTPVGARGVAIVGNRRIQRDLLGGGSYGGDSDKRLHFGLGGATSIDTLEVAWLSGTKQVFHTVAVNQVLKLREGEALVASSSIVSRRRP